jgi:hypothetical protein
MWRGDGESSDFKCIAAGLGDYGYAAGEGSANIRQRYMPVDIGDITVDITWYPSPDNKYIIDISCEVLHAENISGWVCTPYAYGHMNRINYSQPQAQPDWSFTLRKDNAYGGISYFYEISVLTNEGWRKEITTIEVTADDLPNLDRIYVPPEAPTGISASDYPGDNGHKIMVTLSGNPTGSFFIGRRATGSAYNCIDGAAHAPGTYPDEKVQDEVSYDYCAAQILWDNAGFYKSSNFVSVAGVQSINNNSPAQPYNGTGSYNIPTETVNLAWDPPGDPDIAGYWVCPIFPDNPPRSLIIHASPIDRTTFRAPLDFGTYQGDEVIYYIAAMDYAGNIGQWSEPISIIVGTYIALSTSAEATATNNSQKFIRIADSNELWVTYASDGYIYAAKSTDEGATWLIRQLGRGFYPAISCNSVAETPRPSVVWQFEDAGIHYIYFSRYLGDDTWTTAQMIQSGASGTTFGSPSFAIGICDTGHVVYTATSGGTSTIKYTKFYLFNPMPSIPENVGTGQSPSIAYMNSTGKPPIHVAWEYRSTINSIKYRTRTSLGWGLTETPSGTQPAKQPMLETVGNNAYVAWAEDASSHDIYWRYKVYTGPFGTWMPVKQVNSSSSVASTYPVLTGGYSCAWVEQITDAFDVYYSHYDDLLGTWSTPVNISTQAKEETFSNYPYITHKQTLDSTKIYFVWTERMDSPHPIKYKTYNQGSGKGISNIALPYYVAYGGEENPSPFNRKRDGYEQYGNEPYKRIDKANASTFLEYQFETLDPNRIYDLTAYLYQRSSTNLTLSAKIDNVLLGTIILPPDSLVTLNYLIPAALYADNAISFKIYGNNNQAVSAILALHEFENDDAKGNKQGDVNGPQGVESTPFVSYRLSLAVEPSLTMNNMTIKYTLPQKGQVAISLYDVSGRRVRNLVDKTRDAGIYNLDCGTSNLSRGIYFIRLETENKALVQKVIVVK